jgi:hypothetical protein
MSDERLRWLGMGMGAIALTACGPSRQAQCREMATTALEVRESAILDWNRINGSYYDTAADLTAAAQWQRGAEKIRAVAVPDPHLQDLQADIAAAYETAANLMQKNTRLVPLKTLTAADLDKGLADYQLEIEAELATVMAAFHRYCSTGRR